MKRESYKNLALHLVRVQMQGTLNALALNLLVNRTPIKYKIRRYTVRLYDLDAAHGGIMLLTWHPKGQEPQTAAYYAELWVASMRGVQPVREDQDILKIAAWVREKVMK